MATCPENNMTLTVKQMPMMRFDSMNSDLLERTISVLLQEVNLLKVMQHENLVTYLGLIR